MEKKLGGDIIYCQIYNWVCFPMDKRFKELDWTFVEMFSGLGIEHVFHYISVNEW